MYSYYVYILNCADDSFYVGITNDIIRRVEEHQEGIISTCYTFRRRPLKLVFQQRFNNVIEAIYFEKRLKGWSRSKKIALINGDFDFLQVLSECRNATHFKYKPE